MKEGGLYKIIYCSLWDDVDFRKLSPVERLLFVALRTCRQCNLVCIFEFFSDQVQAQTGLTKEVIISAVNTLSNSLSHKQWIVYSGGWIWIKDGLRRDPSFSVHNEKHISWLIKTLNNLPRMQLVTDFIEYYREIKYFQDSLCNRLYQCLSLPIPIPIPIPNPIPKSKRKKISPSDFKKFQDWWLEQFAKENSGEKYLWQGAKDTQLVKTMLGSLGLEKVQERARVFLKSTDPFYKNRKDIGMLKSQINKLLPEKAKPAADRGEGNYDGEEQFKG